MTDHSAGHDAAQRSALGGAWNANPFAAAQPSAGADNTLLNRPANLAQVASPGAAAQNARGWQAQSGAVDFLGLDAELSGVRQAPLTYAQPAQAPTQPAGVPDESWLMGMGEERAARARPVAPEADAELAPTSPLLNAAWQESASKPRKSGLWLPLLACAAGVLALSGVVWMRGGRSADEQGDLVQTDVAHTDAKLSSAAPVAAIPAPEPSAPLYVAGELTPVAPLENEITPPARPDLAVASAREPSDGRVAVESSEGGGLDSMIEVVPALAASTPTIPQAPPESAWASDPNDPGFAPAPIASGEEADAASNVLGEHELDAETLRELEALESQAPIDVPQVAPVSSSARDESVEPAAVASATVAEPVPANSALDATPVASTSTPEPALSTPVNESLLVAAIESLRATQEPASTLDGSPATAAPVDSLPSIVGPMPLEDLAQPSATEPTYGPTANVDAAASVADASVPVGVVERTSKLELEQVLLLDQGESGMRRANVQDLKGMWIESTIPFEAIGAPSKVLTPSVGKVRVVLTGGEIFEGDLYAVGEGCVWLNTQYGRMGLAGARVKSVAQIDSPKGTPALGSPGSEALSGLERARIKTPGGVIYGRVVERDALRTTVMTEDGAKLTLDSKDVELMSQTPTVSIKK